MAEEKFGAIIVGGGVAGASAALVLARAGVEVVVVERGNYAGAKNMTGGRLYGHSLEKLVPGFASEAPVERLITKERISLMTEKEAVTVDYSATEGERGKASYTVLRGIFDRWLMEKAEEAGAMPVTGVKVDDLIFRDGAVVGIIAGGEEMFADTVILADGAVSLLAEKAGLRKEPASPHTVAVGAKEIICLDKAIIEDRFNLPEGEGVSWLFAGYPSDGNIGGGLIYTNRESVSIGVVVTLSEFMKSGGKSVRDMLEDFKNHPAVKPLVKGGRLLEYSGHIVPEGGFKALSTLYGNGVVVAGDAAGFVINAGYTIRGMDLAIASGEAAAEAVLVAREKGDFSASSLSVYEKYLEKNGVLPDMKRSASFPEFLESGRVFNEYPRMAADIMARIFTVSGGQSESMFKKIYEPVRKVGIMNLAKDAFKGVRSL